MISQAECDALPAEFVPGSREPKAAAKNGTIYGEVFPAETDGAAGKFLEIHYYDLWSRDCGRRGHALDAEHVSALVRADGPAESATSWKAVYWYASAHQDTICDSSQGAKASTLGAEDHGPTIWISAGKHASFLSVEACNKSCGEDRCEPATPLSPAGIVNIGEPGAPLNGAVWVDSDRWPMTAKMKPDFSAPARAKLDEAAAQGVIPLNDASPSVKGVVAAGGSTVDALATSNRETGDALATADANTSNALGMSAAHVGRALQRAHRGILKFLGLGKSQDSRKDDEAKHEQSH